MPRHSSLIPLSHDHHEALLITLRLKKGGPASANDKLWPHEFSRQLHSLELYFERELLAHFKIEEEILFPAASQITEFQELISTLLSQHQQLREKAKMIFSSVDEEIQKKEMADFGKLLESHVRLEERELFPKLEEAEREGRIKIPVLK
jgi:iron-sulfur cluster repair protein YtfE (RIC family)